MEGPTLQAKIYNIDYNQFIHILGTTHFTKRSLSDAYHAVNQLKPTDLAIELDMERFQELNQTCATCPKRWTCAHKCEFIGAAEALGNVNGNIWLIDMTRYQFRQRTQMFASRTRVWRVLLNERDTLMAARLTWIITRNMKTGREPNVLALVGAAHVKGIHNLLKNPQEIKENLNQLNLEFTPPKLVKRIQINGD
jgi:pheromone shutdown protein TraB